MRLRRTSVTLGAVGALVLYGAPAHAAPIAAHEMPFPCAQTWKGTTRATHSPSRYAVDWNRVDDFGDPVVATAPGLVTTADSVDDSGYGRYVVVDHGNNEKSLYAHLQSLAVTKGQRVDQGVLLGFVGSSGRSTGPHLHFEERTGSSVVPPYFHQVRYVFGTTLASKNCAEVGMAADWDGDGKAQPTTFRRGAPAVFVYQRPGTTPATVPYGRATDDPVPGDWDGNGTINPGVRRPGTRTFYMRTPAGASTLVFGLVSDRPIAGNWGGDRKWEVGLWTSSRAEFSLRSATGVVTKVRLGNADDLPVTGDWDGDGITDLGVFDQPTATFTLRKVDAEGIVWLATVRFGKAGDLPAVGDWDGNRRTDLGVWTPSTATFTQRIAPSPTTAARTVKSVQFGARR